MIKVLFLDDDENRHQIFIKTRIDAIVDSAYTLDQFFEKLTDPNNFYDEIHLDHDLDGLVYQDSTEKTGYQAAKWVISCLPHYIAHERTLKIFVHSLNRQGALNMIALFVEKMIPVTYRPFGNGL